ncbi:MAG: 3-dehydroquinate synthase, partial [Clostridia bacterium]|nr:3-dehydroquinate synthase [Clostridia bacterium]
MKTVHVNASNEYDVLIGSGLLAKCGELIGGVIKSKKLCLVTDDTVDALYSDKVISSLEGVGFEVIKFVFPHGEASKSAQTYLSLLGYLAKNHITRTDALVALGGGVVGDLTGFAAATYNRGMAFVQIPTTLLAAVDSSVGGKTAIDIPEGKNLVGAFHQPKIVIMDTDTLRTLPEDIYRDGCAEVIKYGVICDGDLFEKLTKSHVKEAEEEVICRCVEIKRDIVAEDEFDKGVRALLNLGHTVGHAVEACSNFEVSHGSAVAIGMKIVVKASVKYGICDGACLDAIENILNNYGFSLE